MNIKTKTKKTISVLMGAVMVMTLFSGLLWEKREVKAADYGIANPVIEDGDTEDGVAIWDTVYFGSYYQSSSETKEPIRWRVLSVEGDDAFLLADECLDCRPYHEENTDVTWETCTLRAWLNDDFYHAAFSSEEQAAIIETDVENHNNPYYGTEGGNDTKDKVYLLSLEEIIDTKYGFSKYIGNSEIRRAELTKYAREQGAQDTYDEKAWWCRSAGCYSNYAAYVDSVGYGNNYGSNVYYGAKAVRPALHLNLSSALWKKGTQVSAEGADVSAEDKTPSPEITPNPVHGLDSPVTEDGVTTWDTVYFGHYYQGNSKMKDPIRWRVLSVDGDDAFLLADKCLDCKAYHDEEEVGSVTWEACSLRAWLNVDFYNAAFDSGEQAAIIETDVENHDNPYFGTEGGNDTRDKVYLLSLEEIINTKYGFSKYIRKGTETRQAGATEYAKKQGAGTNDEGQAKWWCRSAGGYSFDAACVDSDGRGECSGSDVDGDGYFSEAVRPALHLNLASGRKGSR